MPHSRSSASRTRPLAPRGTLVCFHAHPDDEVITTGGTIARAVAEGHRVVLVFATRGELGLVPEDLGRETLGERRTDEASRAAAILGAQAVEYLGYQDSGMAGDDTNDDPGSFWTADVEEAAQRLAAILERESAEVVTIYDDHGGYHHPDHIQVHRVGVRGADLAGTPRVYEATADADHFAEQVRAMRDAIPPEIADEIPRPEDFENNFSPGELITTRVDIGPYLTTKRAALAAHSSQVDETSFFLQMPEELFAVAFGTEWFIRRDAPAGTAETWLFPETAT
jgi:LmbE family N-acetylglucosaminyl deacetylase